MKRQACTPRPDWQHRLEELGCDFHTIDGAPYWDESVCYAFTEAEIDALESATQELEEMCFAAVRHVLDKEQLHRLAIPAIAHPLIYQSWQAREKNLYGRFDLLWDGTGSPKMLEYNADTPTALLEASVLQWQWLEETHPEADQFNSIHEKLLEAWPKLGIADNALWLAAVKDHPEDEGTVGYLMDTAHQAGLDARFLAMDAIGHNGQRFVDEADTPITTLFKLYPWEWLWAEPFADYITGGGTRFIEPAWKMILSGKGLLVILWELFPNHPLLLPASFSPETLHGDTIRKPLWGREGHNMLLSTGSFRQETGGDYGAEGYVWQQYHPSPVFDGFYPVCGSWVIASKPAGLGIREDSTPITTNAARFVPHYFT